jgi:ComF family protein
MLQKIKQLVFDFFHLFYPNICCACGNHLYDGEDCLCVSCHLSFPYTNDEYLLRNNTFKVFEGRVNINAASSLFYFKKKSRVQNLLHYLKYKNHDELGALLGAMHANVLLSSELFYGIDCIIPVPLHPNKLKKRGYNQALLLAKGYAEVLNVSVMEHALIREIDTNSQTKKNRYQRYENMNEVFSCVDADAIAGRAVLLVDDVITTGSTLESCAHVLLKMGCSKVFIASTALA